MQNCAVCHPPVATYRRGARIDVPEGSFISIRGGKGVYHHPDCFNVTGDWDGAESATLGERWSIAQRLGCIGFAACRVLSAAAVSLASPWFRPEWHRTSRHGFGTRGDSLEPYEDIRRVLTRRRLWREESLQLVLTCLIVGGVYPRWGTRSTPTEGAPSSCVGSISESSVRNRVRHARSSSMSSSCHVDTKPSDPDGRTGRCCGRSVVDGRAKTEARSHRPDQLPHYLGLGSHRYPDAAIDLTYLTGPLDNPPPGCVRGSGTTTSCGPRSSRWSRRSGPTTCRPLWLTSGGAGSDRFAGDSVVGVARGLDERGGESRRAQRVDRDARRSMGSSSLPPRTTASNAPPT